MKEIEKSVGYIYSKEISEKHLPGQHDQDTHGREEGDTIKTSLIAPGKISDKDYDNIRKELLSWEGVRQDIAMNALANSRDHSLLVLKDKGKIMAVAAIKAGEDDEENKGDHVYLADLATRERGYGETVMKQVISYAGKKKSSLHLISLKAARPFYSKMGLSQNGAVFSLTAKQTVSMAKSIKDLSIYEPDDGCFTITLYNLK